MDKSYIAKMNRNLNSKPFIPEIKKYNFWIALTSLIILIFIQDLSMILKYIFTYIVLVSITYQLCHSFYMSLVISLGLMIFLLLMKYLIPNNPMMENFDEKDLYEEELKKAKNNKATNGLEENVEISDDIDTEKQDILDSTEINVDENQLTDVLTRSKDGELHESMSNLEDDWDIDEKKLMKFHKTQKILRNTMKDLATSVNQLGPIVEKGGRIFGMMEKLNLIKK